jgi:hypothetical protein
MPPHLVAELAGMMRGPPRERNLTGALDVSIIVIYDCR